MKIPIRYFMPVFSILLLFLQKILLVYCCNLLKCWMSENFTLTFHPVQYKIVFKETHSKLIGIVG